MTRERGTYALVLRCKQQRKLRIGSLGTMTIEPGSYVYVGSAFGTGGLAARIKHHRQIAARPHWHIDYARAHCDLMEVWFTTSPDRHEHTWARAVARLPGARVPLLGFGSSDCGCEAHLLWFKEPPSIRTFRRFARTSVNVHR